MWTAVRVRKDDLGPVEGDVVPLCSRCVLVCPTCGNPVIAPAARSRIPRSTRRSDGGPPRRVVWWAVERCRNGRHERPALRDAPHELKIDTKGTIARPTAIPRWSWVGNEWRDFRAGDRVAAYLPNIPETIAAFLATASIGAIWSVCAPDMAAPAVIDRFKQIEPKVLIACDAVTYAGKRHDRRGVV